MMSTLFRNSGIILSLPFLILSCNSFDSSENSGSINSPIFQEKKQSNFPQEKELFFSIKIGDQIFQFQESQNADMHILGGTVGLKNVTVNVNWETSDSEYGAQLMFLSVPEKQKTYKKLDPNAQSMDGFASFVFTRTKADDFLMLVKDYEVMVEEYEYKNDSGFFTNQKLTCTITGSVNSINMLTKKESILPFEAKIRIAE